MTVMQMATTMIAVEPDDPPPPLPLASVSRLDVLLPSKPIAGVEGTDADTGEMSGEGEDSGGGGGGGGGGGDGGGGGEGCGDGGGDGGGFGGSGDGGGEGLGDSWKVTSAGSVTEFTVTPRAADAAAGVLNASERVLRTSEIWAVGGGTMCTTTRVEAEESVRLICSGLTPMPTVLARATLNASWSKLDTSSSMMAVKDTERTMGVAGGGGDGGDGGGDGGGGGGGDGGGGGGGDGGGGGGGGGGEGGDGGGGLNPPSIASMDAVIAASWVRNALDWQELQEDWAERISRHSVSLAEGGKGGGDGGLPGGDGGGGAQ